MRRALRDDCPDDRQSGRCMSSWVAIRTLSSSPSGQSSGSAVSWKRPSAPGPTSCDSNPVGYIEGWYVDEDVRRFGVGRAG